MINIRKLRDIRNRLGITQKELSKLSNISQSAIAKIESGSLDPTFSRCEMLTEAISNLENRKESKAKDFMVKNILSTTPDQLLVKVAKKMRERSISQVPVFSNNHVVGLVTESNIIENLDNPAFKNLKVSEVMKFPPPILDGSESEGLVRQMLKHTQLVLISDKGSVKGLITRSDLLKRL